MPPKWKDSLPSPIPAPQLREMNDIRNTAASMASTMASTQNSKSTKAKILERLQRAVNDAPPTKNRSPELVPLTAEFEKMKKNLRSLVAAVKRYDAAQKQLAETRQQMVRQMAFMSQNSPIYPEIGLAMDPSSAQAIRRIEETASAGDSVTEVMDRRVDPGACTSLLAVQDFANAQSGCNQREFGEHVVMYAVEWEEAVLERVEADLKSVKKLQNDRSHYEKKVETLRRRANELESRGKESPSAQVEKLDRNESKLKEAFILHETEAGRLCTLIESVTQDGWLELYTLCRNYMKWESNRVGRETDTYAQFGETLESMKDAYKKNTIKPKKGGTITKRTSVKKKVPPSPRVL